MKRLLALLLFLYVPLSFGAEYAAERNAMVDEVLADSAATASYSGKAVLDPQVVAALRKVERHRFVPFWLRQFAYLNRPLPIGHGQTISQPFIVALMTDLMQVKRGDKVLEIGTGSGYQAAVLAEIVTSVYSIEIVEPLGKEAAELLKELGYRNVQTKVGDGYYGWPEAAPFDAIIVTAAADQAAQAGRTHGDPRRHAVRDAVADAGGETAGRLGEHAPDIAGGLRAADRRALV